MEDISCTCNISEEEFECIKHRNLERISSLINNTRSQARIIDNVKLEILSFKEEYQKLKENLRKKLL